uniref:Uncharacterized protein n=1 Tax=Davidia involucrata TaxID=16924 RepID=A0A5B7BWV2_DAVIN
MASSVGVPVFTDTNLGTHIAMAIPPDITAGDFKRELEIAHLNCFPKLGKIRVHGLMVKRKSCFYHLPESLPIKHAFQGLKGTWFLHIEACPWGGFDKRGLSKCVAAEVRDHTFNGSDVADSLESEYCTTSTNKNSTKCKEKKRNVRRYPCLKAVLQEIIRTGHLSKKKKKRKRANKNHFLTYTVNGLQKEHLDRNEGVTADKRFGLLASRTEGEHAEKWNSNPMVENPSETLSETISVTCIIKKYFSDYDEVTSSSNVTSRATQNRPVEQLKTRADDNCSNIQVGAMPQFINKTPPRMLLFPSPTGPSSETSRDKLKRTEVGKRLVVASNYLRISARKQKPATGFCRSRGGKSVVPKSSSLVRSIVFEISGND